jgi:hypothetical protein
MRISEQTPRTMGASLLLAFGASHVAGVVLSQKTILFQHNLVVPFFTNRWIFLFAGLLQILGGGFCILKRKSSEADMALTILAGVLLWYRAARWALGDREACGCAGLLGEYLHLNAKQERSFANFGVALFLAAALPGLVRKGWRRRTRARVFQNGGFRNAAGLPAILAAALALSRAVAAPGVEMQGTMTDLLLNGRGEPHPGTRRFSWSAEISSIGTWRIASTNQASPGWVSLCVFDGTNTYFVQPSISTAASAGPDLPDPALDLAVVGSGPAPLTPADDVCNATALWTAFCTRAAANLTPGEATPEWPIVSWYPRSNLKAWGFRMEFGGDAATVGGVPMPAEVKWKRDVTLMARPFDEEILRPDFLFPMDPVSKGMNEQQFYGLKAYTNGSLGAVYSVREWSSVGTGRAPRKSALSFFGGGSKPHEFRRMEIVVDNVRVGEVAAHQPPPIRVETRVDDYRYGEKTVRKQYPAATYFAAARGQWRSNEDPDLIRQREAYRERGPVYPKFMFSRLHALLYLGLAAGLGLPVYFWVKKAGFAQAN